MKNELQKYLDRYLKVNHKEKRLFECLEAPQVNEDMAMAGAMPIGIHEYINDNKQEETFQTLLFKYIDNKNLKDSDVYNKVNIDRRLFSKIRSNKDYHPSKDTIILLGIALELSEKELEELLNIASYSLPYNNEYDLIIRFCFINKIFDINTINEFLYDHNCKTLNKGE